MQLWRQKLSTENMIASHHRPRDLTHSLVLLQNITGWTALHEAACNGRLNVAETLLHLGADVHSRTNDGDTALHKAARWGRVDTVKLLLLVGADARARDKVRRDYDKLLAPNEKCSWASKP